MELKGELAGHLLEDFLDDSLFRVCEEEPLLYAARAEVKQVIIADGRRWRMRTTLRPGSELVKP